MTMRTNRATNPSFEVNTAGWSNAPTYWTNAGATLSRVTSWAAQGSASMKVACDGVSNQQGPTATFTGLEANTTYIFSVTVKWVSGRPVILRLRDTTNLLDGVDSAFVSTATETRLSASITTGAAGTVQLLCAIVTDATLGVSEFNVDGVLLEKSSAVNPYFDGATPNTTTAIYGWTGTAHASTSNEAGLEVEVAFTTTPDDPAPVWTDITAYVDLRAGLSITTGRGDGFAAVQTGSLRAPLNNTDGRFTPGNTASPYFPNVKIRKKIRAGYQNPTGGARLHRYTGYVEEWPTEWPGGSTYSTAAVTASDRFKRLGSVALLKSIIEQEYLADAPSAYFTLGEPDGATTAGDVSKNAVGFLTATQVGTGGTLTFGANTGPPTDAMSAPAFAPVDVSNGLNLTKSGMSLNPDPILPTSATFEASVLSTATSRGILRATGANGAAEYVEMSISATGKLQITASQGGISATASSAGSVNDGATHNVAMVATQTLVTAYLDGVSVATLTPPWYFTPLFTQLTVGGAFGSLFTGTISHVAAFGSALTAARLLVHRAAATTGFAGERSDQRIARLAGYAGVLPAEMSLGVGSSTSIAHVDTTGLAPLQAMQDVAATEGGVLFINSAGLLTFHARSKRYNAANAMTINAANVDSSLRFIANDAALVNDVTAGRAGGATIRAVNASSVADYGTSAINLTLLTTSDLEVADAANWKANASAAVNPRLPNLTVDLLTSPTLTASALLLGLGSRITLSGLPSQAPASSVDLFIEGYSENISMTGWVLAFNTSPAADSGVWQLDSPVYSILGTSTRLAY